MHIDSYIFYHDCIDVLSDELLYTCVGIIAIGKHIVTINNNNNNQKKQKTKNRSDDLSYNSNQSFPHYLDLLMSSLHQAFEDKKPVHVKNMSTEIIKGLQCFECPNEVANEHIKLLCKCDQ